MINNILDKRKIKLTLFFLIFWTPFYLTFFPGVGLQDEIYMSLYSMKIINQPFLYDIILHLFYNIGISLGHPIIGLGIFVLILMVLTAWSISYVILWLRDKTKNNYYYYFTIFYYSITPIIIDYAITAVKDRVFGVILMLLIPILYQCTKEKFSFSTTKEIIVFSLLMVSLCLTRSNGLHIMILTDIVILFISGFRKKIIILLSCIFFLCTLPSLFTLSDFTESIGVPLQQISRVVYLHRNIPEKDKEFINKMMPIEDIEKKYNPSSSDMIKWNEHYNRSFVNHNKIYFFKTWLSLLIKYPKDYVFAWYYVTNGYWTITPWIDAQSKMVHAYDRKIYTVDDKLYVNGGYALSEENFLPEKIKIILGSYLLNFAVYIPSGACFLIAICIAVIFIFKKNLSGLVCILPPIFASLTLILAAPINGVFRYTFYYALCLPIYLGLLFAKTKVFSPPSDTRSSKE